MGSWGEGPFENDAAMDFLRDLEGKSVGAGLERAFKAAVRDRKAGYVDVDEGSHAWAAAELVAIALGHPYEGVRLREEEVAARINGPAAFVPGALAALDAITGEESELWGLWKDGGGEGLDPAFASLRERLQRPASTVKKVNPRPAKGTYFRVPTGDGHFGYVRVIGKDQVAVIEYFDDGAAVRAGLERRTSRRRAKVLLERAPSGWAALGVGVLPATDEGEAYWSMEFELTGCLAMRESSGPSRDDMISGEEAYRHPLMNLWSHAELEGQLRDESSDRIPPGVWPRGPEQRRREFIAKNAQSFRQFRAAATPHALGTPRPASAAGVDTFEPHDPGRFEPSQLAWNLSLARQGGSGYGRPSLASDAALYFQVGLVCAWLGVIPEADLPERIRSWLAGPFVDPLAEAFAALPPKLREQMRGGAGGGAPKATPDEAREGALWALDRLVDGDSALLIAWETGPDGGRAFRAAVDELREALLRAREP